jgi:hypothetical protein
MDNAFDGIIAYGSLYYAFLNEMLSSINEVWRILRVGGKALIVTRTKNDCRYNNSAVQLRRQHDFLTYRLLTT